MARRSEIDEYLSALLQTASFKDYGPNGLQIEGCDEVRRLVSGVTASRALIDAAIERPLPTPCWCITACSGGAMKVASPAG